MSETPLCWMKQNKTGMSSFAPRRRRRAPASVLSGGENTRGGLALHRLKPCAKPLTASQLPHSICSQMNTAISVTGKSRTAFYVEPYSWASAVFDTGGGSGDYEAPACPTVWRTMLIRQQHHPGDWRCAKNTQPHPRRHHRIGSRVTVHHILRWCRIISAWNVTNTR